MSHIVTIRVEVKDFDAIQAACRRLALKQPSYGRAEIFNTTVEGVLVELGNDWIYPVVCILETGEVKYDNFEGTWGDEKHLHRFVQMYSVEKATLEARRKGYGVIEQPLADGSVKLTLNVGNGGVA